MRWPTWRVLQQAEMLSMLRSLFRGHAQRVYGGAALLLLVLTLLGFTRLPRSSPTISVIGVFCFVALSCLFALVQDGISLPAPWKRWLAWSWAIGAVLLATGWPGWHDLLLVWVQDPRWRRALGMIDLLLPAMMLLPTAAVILGVARGRQGRAERAYLLAGFCLLVLFFAQSWLNLFEIWFAPFISVDWFMAALFWLPVCLVVATLGTFLGCLPRELHLWWRHGSVLVACYLAAAALVPLGFVASVIRQPDLADAAAFAVALGVFAPAAAVTRGWMLSRLGKG